MEGHSSRRASLMLRRTSTQAEDHLPSVIEKPPLAAETEVETHTSFRRASFKLRRASTRTERSQILSEWWLEEIGSGGQDDADSAGQEVSKISCQRGCEDVSAETSKIVSPVRKSFAKKVSFEDDVVTPQRRKSIPEVDVESEQESEPKSKPDVKSEPESEP